MKLRMAGISDLSVIMAIVAEGRMAQRRQGFFQWADGYPDDAVILDDIRRQAGRLLIADDGDTAGYASLILADPGYSDVDDVWAVGGEYAVVHRMVISDRYRGKGLCDSFFELLEQESASIGVSALRVDTGEANMVMRHMMQKRGFRNAGLLRFPWGDRLAYEKQLEN